MDKQTKAEIVIPLAKQIFISAMAARLGEGRSADFLSHAHMEVFAKYVVDFAIPAAEKWANAQEEYTKEIHKKND